MIEASKAHRVKGQGDVYLCSGLNLQAERPIPWLLVQPLDSPVDVRVSFEEMPSWADAFSGNDTRLRYESGGRDDRGIPTLQVVELEGRGIMFRYGDGIEFLIDRAGTQVWVRWPEPFTIEDATTYLLGPIVGWLLRLRGVIPLHASAVAVDGRAVAFLGPAGSGKSTLAAGFAELGFAVLSDDVLALHQRLDIIEAVPSYPVLRLWPDSARLLFGSPHALPPLTPNWEKRGLDLTRSGYAFGDRPLPLAALYTIDGRDDGVRLRVEDVPGKRSIVSLAANTYLAYLLDRGMRAREFVFLAAVLRRVRLRRLSVHLESVEVLDLCRGLAAEVSELVTRPR